MGCRASSQGCRTPCDDHLAVEHRWGGLLELRGVRVGRGRVITIGPRLDRRLLESFRSAGPANGDAGCERERSNRSGRSRGVVRAPGVCPSPCSIAWAALRPGSAPAFHACVSSRRPASDWLASGGRSPDRSLQCGRVLELLVNRGRRRTRRGRLDSGRSSQVPCSRKTPRLAPGLVVVGHRSDHDGQGEHETERARCRLWAEY